MHLVMVLAVALLANGNFSELDGKGRPVGWAVDRTHWSVAKGVAKDGSNALVWTNADPNVRVTAMQSIRLEHGKMYSLDYDIRIDGRLDGNAKGGASAYIEYFGENMKWLSGTYGDVYKKTDDSWIHVCRVSGEIPTNAVSYRLGLTVNKGLTGRVSFANVSVREFELPAAWDPMRARYRYADGKAHGRRVWIDRERRCIVDGKPFFPLGVYGGGGHMELIGKSPFNTLMLYGAPDRAKLDEARRNGLMVISGVNHFPLTPEGDAALAEYVRSVKDHPALLAWYAFDEAPITEVPRWEKRRDLLEKLDDDHPVWGVMNHPTWTGQQLGMFDVGGADPYPVPNEPLEQCTSWTENVVRRTGRRRAVWMVPQAFNWANYDRPFGRVPTREELRTMTRLCLDAGATGLVYFKFGDLMNNAKSPSTTFESRWADLVAVVEEIRPEWAGRLDNAPVWKDVQTVYYDTASDPAFTVKGEYFKGRLVSAADDSRTGSRKFFLRRAFTLPSKPVKAYFQAMGDNEATFFLNGEKVLKFRYSNEPYAPNRPGSGEVSAKLKEGENLLTADYSISEARRMGGVLLELLVLCEGGETVRVDSDGRFESSADGKTWKGVSLFDPPPAPPRLSRLAYRDFAHPRRYFGGAPSKSSVAAGERITLGYTFGGTVPEGTFTVRVNLRKGSSCYWAEEIDVRPSDVTKLGDGKWRMDVPFETPLYIHSGEYTLDMDSNSLFCPSQDRFGFNLTVTAPESIPGFPKPLTVEMRKRNGYPTLHVDGKPTSLLWGGVDAGRRADCKPRHSDMPLTAVTVYQYYWQWHPRMGEYDFSWFDRKAELYRRSNPDAYYIWDLTVYPAGDFAQKYPEEMASDDTGDRAPVGRFSWSFASKRGMAEMKEIIEKAIAYVESSPYANRVIGYRVNSGVTIEWLGWDAKPGRVKDFSEPNKKAFREFAAKHYPDLADPHVPDLAERNALDGEFDILWDQKKHENAIAYMDYNSWIIAQDILETSGHAKKVLAGLGRKKIVGTYYGYSWYLNCSGRDQRRGHFALQHLLDNNNGTVDFLMSPNSYAERNLGETCGDMKPFATLAAAGIMSVMEDDTRTHNRKWPMWLDYNQTHNPEQTRAVLARNGSVCLCHRSSPYFYSLCTGYDSDSPECAEVGRALRTVMDFRIGHDGEGAVATRPGGRHAEIALVESERSQTAIPGLSRWVKTGFWTQSYGPDGEVLRREQKHAIYNGEINCNAQSRFARSGAPVDLLLAEDLKNSAGDYKLYVFYNVLKYDRTMLEAVRKLRERGATLVWIYAPGYLNGNSLESMRELTGMAFEEIEGGGIAAVTVKEDGRLMGSPDAQVAKLFAPTDADVVLGTYANGKPGLAAKKTGKSVSFFSGAWQLDQEFIAELVRRSRAHVYCTSDDPMEADDSLFTLHARNPGRKTVKLPRKVAAVVDVFNRRIVARDTDTFEFDAALHSTHLFYYGDDGDELLARQRRNDMNHE